MEPHCALPSQTRTHRVVSSPRRQRSAALKLRCDLHRLTAAFGFNLSPSGRFCVRTADLSSELSGELLTGKIWKRSRQRGRWRGKNLERKYLESKKCTVILFSLSFRVIWSPFGNRVHYLRNRISLGFVNLDFLTVYNIMPTFSIAYP